MSDRSVIQVPEAGRTGTWLDAYMPEGQAVAFAPRQQLINMALIRGILFRQRWLFAVTIFVALVIGVVVTLLATPMYEAAAKVRVSPRGTFVIEGQDIEGSISGNQLPAYLSTQVEVIKSQALADAVAEELNLGSRNDLLGKDIDERRPPNASDAQWLKQKTNIAATRIKGLVDVEVPRNSWVITIKVRSEKPVLAAELANGYADAFVASGSDSTLESNEYAREYLRDQIEIAKESLKTAELAANDYARTNGIVTGIVTGGVEGTGTTLTTENLAAINTRVSSARAARIEAEQRWRSIQNAPASQLPEAQSNSALQALLAERTKKRSELVELRQRYTDDFPQIQTLLTQIDILDGQIDRTGSDIKATVRNAYIVAQNQENALRAELSSVSGDKLVEQDRQVEYGFYEREAQALRDELKTLLERYNQLSSAANVESGAIAKLDPATVPRVPYEPSIPKTMGIALLFGIAMAGGLALLRETLDDRIRSLDDLEEKIGVSLLGHTPYVEQADLEVDGSNRFSALMEAYSSIRAAIDFTLPRSRNVIQLTSTQASEGKSTTAVIIAELFASFGRKTLLIDADLRRPSVARLLDIERPKAGLVEVVLGHVNIEDVISRGVHENLDILTIGEIPPNPAEILASDAFRIFIEARREEYGLIIIDGSPIMGLADAPILSRLVDGTIFVLEANRVPFGQVRTAIRRIRLAGGNMLGVVVTKYRALEAGQAYDYQYGYYQYGKDD